MADTPLELTADLLRRICNPEDLAFTTTDEIDKLVGIIGQERATRAIEFGIDIDAEGYNIFAMGPSGAGKSSILKRYLQRRAGERKAPQDWIYVRNANDAYRPRALALPPGRGRAASADLRDALRQTETALAGAFSGSLYEEARDEVLQGLQKHQQQIFRQLEAIAHQHSFALLQTPSGLTFAPMIDGKALSSQCH